VCLARPPVLEPRHSCCSELGDVRIGVAGLSEDLGGVLAEPGRRRSVPDAVAIGGQRQADRPESGELLKDPQRLRLFALGDLAHVLDRSRRHAGLAQPLQPDRRAFDLETLLEQWDQLAPVRDPERIRCKTRVVGKAWEPDDLNSPSRVQNTWYGAMSGNADPSRPAISAVAR